MTDANGVWIVTTTGFGFDIFHFTAYLQSATLLELHTRLAFIEETLLIEEALFETTSGDMQAEAAGRLAFYNNLHHHISIEICDRTQGSFKPQAPN